MPAKEDCAARSLVKGELQDKEEVVPLKDNGEDDSVVDEDDDEGTRKESRKEDGEETGNICEPKSSELSYNQRRKKNIEENKRLLEEVMGGRHPISESLGNKKTPKERVTKNLKAHSDEPAVRRESQRNKVRRYCFNCDISYDK